MNALDRLHLRGAVADLIDTAQSVQQILKDPRCVEGEDQRMDLSYGINELRDKFETLVETAKKANLA